MKGLRISASAACLLAALLGSHARAAELAGTSFTYQGQLKMDGAPLTAIVDLEFTLWGFEAGGQSLAIVLVPNVSVDNGLFTAEVDFGTDAFNGDTRWLSVGVAYPAGSLTFVELTPRQRLTPSPYAMALPGLWPQQNATCPNLVGGWSGNFITPGVVGGTISGGGGPGSDPKYPDFNAVTDDYGTVGGGLRNHAGNFGDLTFDAKGATVAGGQFNIANALRATVGGGYNCSAMNAYATVAGGSGNSAQGDYAFIGGGYNVQATAQYAVAAGGWSNTASGDASAVGGGGVYVDPDGAYYLMGNVASGKSATVPGGWGNFAEGDFSLAAGFRAVASHKGSFVWADATDAPSPFTPFESTGDNQFLIRASGGVGIGTNTPESPLHIHGGNWNLDTTEGDFKIGDASTRLKIGVALGGGGRGICRIRAQGGANALWLGSSNEDIVMIRDGLVGIGVPATSSKLTVAGTVESTSGGFKFPDGSLQTTAAADTSNLWSLSGNAGTTPGTDFIGTTDPAPLEFRVNNRPVLTIVPNSHCPSVIAGFYDNAVSPGVAGGTIGGGGGQTHVAPQVKGNTVTDDFGTVAGGWNNQAGDGLGTANDAVGATVSGGWNNQAGGEFATVGGGTDNLAAGIGATVPGGGNNVAEGRFSFAAGYYARAIHEGSFVWADPSGEPFVSTGPAQFLIRAPGGVGIGTDDPAGHLLAVAGSAAKPGGGSWSVYSDERLKKNIKPLSGALDRLLKLRGVTFEYKDPDAPIALPGVQTGLIAQEVEKVFPEWVAEDANGYKYVTVHGLEALLVEALRELRDQRDTDVDALRSEAEQLRQRLAQVERAVHELARRSNTEK